ncbi:MAG TPA: hypothetical protein VGO96_18415 [Pyrinomonadaceae bacterium]|jgi:hypothetical protein|nr:hypothetical protein [Pyrinomonadaceae bacterium]
MQNTFRSATSCAATLSLALILVLSALTAGALNSYGAGIGATIMKAEASAAPLPDQSGYWAQVVARDATVRVRPGGGVLGKLTNGQWFHVYPSYSGSPAWVLGYMCPRGNRGCSNRESIAGFIMRSVLTGPRAAVTMDAPVTAMHQAAALSASDDALAVEDVRFLTMSFHSPTSLSGTLLTQGSERRICSDEVWMRNDRLWPIELLRKNERFYVERYTDGSKNDGQRRWAIGRARGIRGRVMVTSLCP